MTNYISRLKSQTALAASALMLTSGIAMADQVILDDLIVTFSACIGNDCANGEAFGFDTLRLKENNVRIGVNDTSASASFPNNDWQLTFNDSDNGGANKFSIDDITNGKTPFTIEASAPSNSLFVEDTGQIGVGTSNPVVEVHVVDGNTPTLRLEQNGSDGFTAQTWDVAGNETNFFVRDATNSSKLPFRIRANSPGDSIFVQNNGNVGFGTDNPTGSLHVFKSGAGNDSSLILNTGGSGGLKWEVRAQESSGRLNLGIAGGNTPLKIDENANNNLLKLGDNANSDAVIVTGQLIVNGQTMNVPDYVFEADYNLRPLAEVAAFIDANGHLPGVPSAKTINTEKRFNIVDMQLKLLEKVEELTLYTLEQEATIAELKSEVQTLKIAN